MAVAAPTLPLTRRSAMALARVIRDREVTAREVVEEHIEVLERAQPVINALAADRFDAARAEAEAADRRVAETATPEDLPPLLGVPCTIKESYAVAGMPNCAGLVSRREHRAQTSAVVVQRLVDAGAIVLGVTNTSELTLWIETENRVYGRTHNAYRPGRTAGGSSGGEGAVVGTGGAPFGLGTDFGGSIRLPAFFNGVFGHKASVGLIPATGHFPLPKGEASRLLALGPLARRAEDLMPIVRLMAGPDGHDPLVREIELGDPGDVSLDGLDVAVSDGTSLLPVRREMREARERAADALGRAGARVRRAPLKGMRRAAEFYLAAVSTGAGTSIRELLAEAGAPAVTLRSALRRGGPHTGALRLALATENLPDRLGSRRLKRMVAAGRALADEIAGVVGEGVLLHPPFPRVAPRHGATIGRPWVLANAAVFNLAGLPVTQVPLGLGRRGLPLGVQVVAGAGRDHVSIAAALELERALGGWVPPPGR